MIEPRWAEAALAAGLTWAVGAAAAPRPEAAPTSFTTDNYELTARVPAGLFHCPYPPDWIGSDHGIVIYLVKPTACDPAGPTAAQTEAPALPRITLFYSYNAADIDLPNGGSGPPRNNAEWLPAECPGPALKRLAGQRLLGEAAVECIRRQGGTIRRLIGTLYRQNRDRRRPAPAPDCEVWVSLDTTVLRASHDMAAYRAVADSLQLCRSADRPAQPARPPCPAFVQW